MHAPAIFAWFPDGEARRISPPVGYYARPTVHPDGAFAVYWGGAVGSPGVWKSDLERRKAFRLTSMASGAWHPSYGLRGDEIAFVSDRYGEHRSPDVDEIEAAPGLLGLSAAVEAHVFVMQLDGRGVRQVTSGRGYDRQPALAPDGERVAFVSNRGGRPGVWVAPATDHADATRVAAGVAAESLAWSVDGETLFVTLRARDSVALAAIPAAGGPARPIATATEFREASVDPRGALLLVHARCDGAWLPCELAIAGGEPRPLRPPGFRSARHATRARNGVIVFESREPTGAAA